MTTCGVNASRTSELPSLHPWVPRMSSAIERRRHHQNQARNSATNLDQARQRSAQENSYSSTATRRKLKDELFNCTNGLKAYEWQVDVAEAILLGLDCTVIAGTGAGKTLPFVMPLFIKPQKTVLIISPLNSLEEDQVRCLNHILVHLNTNYLTGYSLSKDGANCCGCKW